MNIKEVISQFEVEHKGKYSKEDYNLIVTAVRSLGLADFSIKYRSDLKRSDGSYYSIYFNDESNLIHVHPTMIVAKREFDGFQPGRRSKYLPYPYMAELSNWISEKDACRPICPHCFVEIPLVGQCGMCGFDPDDIDDESLPTASSPEAFNMPCLESVLMKPRNDNPALYRENVYKSWKIMSHVVANVDDECLVAHLEPNPGVGYDCLSLITKDESGRLRTRFMLNRNGENSNVLDRVWDRFDQVGCDQVAEEIVEASGLQLSRRTVSSAASIFCNEVVTWIENHRKEEFCVGPIGWPGGCRTFLELARGKHDETIWPITDHGPELCLGIGGVESVRLYQNIHTPLPFPVKVGSKLDRASEIRSLATAIACCDEIDRACVDRKHPCHKIVTTQREFGEEYRQVPEAWAGNLEHARVIFVSSNPSISTPRVPGTGEMYPLAGYFDSRIKHPDWPIERVTDFQVNRLDQSRKNPFVTYNAQFLCTDLQYRGSDSENGTKASQKYWKSAIKQAQDLLGPAFDLSRDICMTEIVHCKSKGEQGVSKSSGTCSEKYLAKTLQLSGSLLVLVGGAKARAQVHAHRQEWQDDGLATWDISEGFGFFRKGDNHPSDHVGLIRIQDETKIVVATEQLSYASNTNRFVQSVIGETAFNKLAMHLRSDSPTIFGSRLEVLDFLRI